MSVTEPPPTFFFIFLLLLAGSSAHTASSQHVDYLPGFTGKLPFQLQTGYIGVGESEEIQMFYYFIESEKSPEDDPLILWLQGGPGCSGFSGLVFETGPITFDYGNFDGDTPKLIYNPYSWTQVANVIFIDQPAGAGYSYAKTAEAYGCNDTLIGKQIHEFIRKWLINHPKYLKYPLYLAGESYCGISIPLAVTEIYNGNDAGSEPRLNMKGFILGNPITDLFGDVNGRVYYAYRMGLLSDELYLSAKENCNGNYKNVDLYNDLCKDDMERVNQCVGKIDMAHILESWCDSSFVKQDLMQLHVPSSYEEHSARFLQSVILHKSETQCRQMNHLYSYKWANLKLVQEALHIREGTVSEWVRCNIPLKIYQIHLTSSPPGDHDMGASHTATEEWIRSLELCIQSNWRPWFVKGQIGGYTTTYFNDDYEMTYATVKGGGHTAPEYKPEECLSMLDRWLNHKPL